MNTSQHFLTRSLHHSLCAWNKIFKLGPRLSGQDLKGIFVHVTGSGNGPPATGAPQQRFMHSRIKKTKCRQHITLARLTTSSAKRRQLNLPAVMAVHRLMALRLFSVRLLPPGNGVHGHCWFTHWVDRVRNKQVC